MDKDEIGGPNDIYESLGVKVMAVSDIWYLFCSKLLFKFFLLTFNSSLESILDEMTRCLDEQYFKILLSKEWYETTIYKNKIKKIS